MAGFKPTFNQILEKTERANSERLMRKARRANRIAKTVRGKQRQVAYAVKHKALGFLVGKIPGQAAVRRDWTMNDFVVIGLKDSPYGLHFPTILVSAGSGKK